MKGQVKCVVDATLPLEVFWDWIQNHPNCILRVGHPLTVLYDDDDLHWCFGEEGEFLLVQQVRGKRLYGELLVVRDDVSYVQGVAGDREGEFIFDLVQENESGQSMAGFFVLCHGFEDDEDPNHTRVVH